MKKQKTSKEQLIEHTNEAVNDTSTADDAKAHNSPFSKSTLFSKINFGSSSSKTKSDVSFMKFGTVTLMIAIVGVVISVDSLLKLKEWNAGLKSFQAQIDSRLELEQQHLDSLEKSLQDIDSRQKNLDKQLNYYHSVIMPILQKNQPMDVLWQLQKTYNWLQQAELDLRWSGDFQGALLLLKASSGVLKQYNIPELQSLQTLIEQNISALAAVEPINETSFLSQIKVVSDEITSLPSPTTSTSPSTEVTTPQESVSGWHATLNKTIEAVKKIVLIKPSNGKPLSAEDLGGASNIQSKQRINETLFMILQQAQWALLKKDNTLFQWSIEQAINTIQKNGNLIDLNNAKTVLCLQHLESLKQQNLTPQLPNLQPLCDQLKAYIDALMIKPIANTESSSSPTSEKAA